MDRVSLELGQAVTREVLGYYQLVVLARTKHCLLRGGRLPEAKRLADLETRILAYLEILGLTRRFVEEDPQLSDDPAFSRYLTTMNQAKVSLIRRLRPVAHANRAAEVRRALARSPLRSPSVSGRVGSQSMTAASQENA